MRFAAIVVAGVLVVGLPAPALGAHQQIRSNTSAPGADLFAGGMAMYYGFDYDAAIALFEEAAAREPGSALPAWAIALALGPNLNDRAMQGRMPKAYASVVTARELARNGPARVRDLVDALGVRYTAGAEFDLHALNRGYAERMKSLTAKYPGDDDIAVLYAESLILAEPAAGAHAHAVVNEAALATIEGVLARSPRHLGANHYHIHLLEGVQPDRALTSAQRLDEIRPDAGHLLHMPSHIYLRLGDYHAAVSSNQRAFAADIEAEKRTAQFPAMGYHTREFLAAAAGLTGQAAVAKQADDSRFSKLRFNRWQEVLQGRQPPGGVSRLEWHVARVLAFVGVGRIVEAKAERSAYAAFESTIPTATKWWADPLDKFLPMVRHEMDARIAWAEDSREQALAHWQQAVAAQDGLTRLESIMPWFHSLREPLGAALLLSGRTREAEQTFRDDLQTNPGSGRALYGLWKALEAQERSDEAGAVEAQFREAWKNADTPLTLEGL